jgi:hypothetical protein
MKFISPEMVRDAARRHGLTLVSGTAEFLSGYAEREGCPVDALLLDHADQLPDRARCQSCSKSKKALSRATKSVTCWM